MNAKQARLLAEKRKTTGYIEIKAAITNAAGNGAFYIWWHKQLSDQQKEKLIEDGFTISDESHDRGDYLVKISWAVETK